MSTIEAETKIKREIKELSLLFRISQILDSSINLRDVVGIFLGLGNYNLSIIAILEMTDMNYEIFAEIKIRDF